MITRDQRLPLDALAEARSSSVVNVLGLIGGVGGTITMAAHGYWMIAKGWKDTGWLAMMWLDNAVGYVMTGIFAISMLVVGAEMLRGQDLTAGDSVLRTLGTALGEAYGEWARILFLVGFLSVTTSSLLGVWNGVKRIAADGRSGWLSNLLLTAASALFAVLLVFDLVGCFG